MKCTPLFCATLVSQILFAVAGCAPQSESNGSPETSEARSANDGHSDETSDSPPASVAPGTASPLHGGAATHAEAAAASLQTLGRLVSPQKMLGFQSVSEVATASLTPPLAMFMVGLDSLRAYRAGDDPRPLFLDEGTVFYPVTAGGGIRSSVVVRKGTNGEWKATQFGRGTLARLASEGRKSVSVARGVAESTVSLVEIPTLSARMLAHEERGVAMLTTLLDVPGTDIRAGATLPAADVLAKLQPLAAQLKDMRPN